MTGLSSWYGSAVLVTAIVALFTMFASQIDYSFSDDLNPGIYSTNSTIANQTYQYWVQQWWKWNNGLAESEHPRDLPDRSCDVNQKGPVFFLPDFQDNKPEIRTCNIPAGKAVLIPIVTGTQDDVTIPNISNEQLMAESKMCNSLPNAIREASINGKRIIGLDSDYPYRTNSSTIFYMDIPGNGTYPEAVEVSPIKAFADGWFLFLEPLKHGDQKHIQLSQNIPLPVGGDERTVQCKQFGVANWIIKSVG